MDPSTAPAEPAGPAPALFDQFAEARLLDRRSLVQRMLKSVPPLALALLPMLARSSDASQWVTFGFLALYVFVAVPLIVLQYLRFRYWVTPRELMIHSGVLTRRKRSIPLDRIQNIVIERSLLPRLLGTAKVKIETAGSTSTEGVLEYVGMREAQDLRAVVRAYQRRLRDEAPAAVPAPAADAPPADAPVARREAPAEAPQVLFTMPLRHIFLSGVFRFSLIYIALIFSGLQYVMDLLGLAPDDIANWLIRGGFQPYTETAQTSPWLLGVATVIAAALLGWITGVAVNLNKFYGFRLWLEGDKLHRRHGLLTVSEGTIPLAKVQSLILRSNPLMRRFGWYRLELQTMGYDVQQQGYQVAAPFAQLADLLALAAHIRPFTLPETFLPVSPLTIRRSAVRYSVVLLALVLPTAYFWPPALWGLLALPLLLLLAVLQYRHHGYALAEDILYIRRGVFQQYLWVVPVERCQVFFTAGTYFQRRLRLRTLIIDSAGAGTFRYPHIVDVEVETGAAFMQHLYRRFQAHFAPASSV